MSKHRKNQIARMDKEWSRQVVERDKSTCQKCGKFAENPHHVFLRGKFGSRWVIENGINLCEDHHVPWAHAMPEIFMAWWRQKVKEDVYLRVLVASRKLKVDLDEAERLLKEKHDNNSRYPTTNRP